MITDMDDLELKARLERMSIAAAHPTTSGADYEPDLQYSGFNRNSSKFLPNDEKAASIPLQITVSSNSETAAHDDYDVRAASYPAPDDIEDNIGNVSNSSFALKYRPTSLNREKAAASEELELSSNLSRFIPQAQTSDPSNWSVQLEPEASSSQSFRNNEITEKWNDSEFRDSSPHGASHYYSPQNPTDNITVEKNNANLIRSDTQETHLSDNVAESSGNKIPTTTVTASVFDKREAINPPNGDGMRSVTNQNTSIYQKWEKVVGSEPKSESMDEGLADGNDAQRDHRLGGDNINTNVPRNDTPPDHRHDNEKDNRAGDEVFASQYSMQETDEYPNYDGTSSTQWQSNDYVGHNELERATVPPAETHHPIDKSPQAIESYPISIREETINEPEYPNNYPNDDEVYDPVGTFNGTRTDDGMNIPRDTFYDDTRVRTETEYGDQQPQALLNDNYEKRLESNYGQPSDNGSVPPDPFAWDRKSGDTVEMRSGQITETYQAPAHPTTDELPRESINADYDYIGSSSEVGQTTGIIDINAPNYENVGLVSNDAGLMQGTPSSEPEQYNPGYGNYVSDGQTVNYQGSNEAAAYENTNDSAANHIDRPYGETGGFDYNDGGVGQPDDNIDNNTATDYPGYEQADYEHNYYQDHNFGGDGQQEGATDYVYQEEAPDGNQMLYEAAQQDQQPQPYYPDQMSYGDYSQEVAGGDGGGNGGGVGLPVDYPQPQEILSTDNQQPVPVAEAEAKPEPVVEEPVYAKPKPLKKVTILESSESESSPRKKKVTLKQPRSKAKDPKRTSSDDSDFNFSSK